ncbi:hypothetical protein FRACYDRAFT_235189 [Fragilariopsis cylindrus CCMP1102]|uniref:MYND-type domain-containing protein n=1 Tax=Fragilariopsis cylindrus CCMP1102 TaxID=635003 RepID=A0A1E7FTY2_9STRA|nr:hypothetical protein FRACYDRAFT_235189 [Fragilariopsis cylindrus CCMP1102]|eukprot:OEU21565.1 hypothetical protein FRACYDRAFT_235189 [Fragilariopsis cylindrus CCMP1102]
MSSQESFSSAQRSGSEAADLCIAVAKEKVSEKTDDPEAQNYDEATEMFYNGLRHERLGNLNAATLQIACAFLLNSRSINFATALPTGLDQTKKDMILDDELLVRLVMRKPDSYACSVLAIMLGQFMGRDPLMGQTFIGAAMVVIDMLLVEIESDPSRIESPEAGILGVLLTRTNLLFQRSGLHMTMGNRKKAIKDLTMALKIDKCFTKARESRACIYAAFKLKDDRTIHGEFKRVVEEYHKDNRGNEVAYGWLAVTIFNDSSLGSIDEANAYYDKCLKATLRRDEIYGQRSIDQLPEIIQVAHLRFQQHPSESLNSQRNLSGLIASMRDTTVNDEESRKDKYVCVKCGAKRKPDGGTVMKCTRCKSTSYCSRVCQKADWASHKHFCKAVESIASIHVEVEREKEIVTSYD